MENAIRTKLLLLLGGTLITFVMHVTLGLLLMYMSDVKSLAFLDSELITFALPFVAAFISYFIILRRLISNGAGQKLPGVLLFFMSFFIACFSAYVHFAFVVSIWGS